MLLRAFGMPKCFTFSRGMGVGCDDIHGVLDKYGDCKSLRSIIRINHGDW